MNTYKYTYNSRNHAGSILASWILRPIHAELRALDHGMFQAALPGTWHFSACKARRGNSQSLAKSSPYAGPSAGAEVARLRKWRVRRLLGSLGGAPN